MEAPIRDPPARASIVRLASLRRGPRGACSRARCDMLQPDVGYAKKNLRDVKDMAVQFGFSKTQEARFPRDDLGAEQTGMNFLIIKAGQREAFAHRHRTAEEIYVVLSGSGRVKLD